MGVFRKWLEDNGTSTGDVAGVPMRSLMDRKTGRPYFGVPGWPSPYDPEHKPTIVGRDFAPAIGKSKKKKKRKKGKKFKGLFGIATFPGLDYGTETQKPAG